MATDKSKSEMDPSVREGSTAESRVQNQPRVAYALEQLVAEVTELFPETPVEYSDYTGWNVALTASFQSEDPLLGDLLDMTAGDDRVADVYYTAGNHASVSVHKNTRTQDDRAPFELAAIFAVIVEDEGSL